MIELAEEELKSDDIAVFGKRVLTMAKQEGKGWFAIMLGKSIFHETNIPEYIINAIVFAKDSFSAEIIADISIYRINKNIADDENHELDFSLSLKS